MRMTDGDIARLAPLIHGFAGQGAPCDGRVFAKTLSARRPRAYAIVRPILDFMQSMSSFAYFIPVVAFIGPGKPVIVFAAMIFGFPR